MKTEFEIDRYAMNISRWELDKNIVIVVSRTLMPNHV